MALNFWHADFKHIPVESIAKEPSPAQAQALVNLKRMLRAFGSSSEEFSVPKSGRRLTSLIALLSDLSEFATWRGIGGSAYSRSFPGASDINKKETYVPRNLSRAEELRPYRALDPDRLVLSGKASWDPDRFLSDMLWMAFQEPNSLLWTASERSSLVPDLAKESYESGTKAFQAWALKRLGGNRYDRALEGDFLAFGGKKLKKAIDGSQVARENGVVTVGAPVHKRLALAYVSLTLAKMRYTTDALHACLVGGWEVYKIPLSEVSQDSPKVTRLSRGMAQELIMLSVLCPFFATDISTHIQERCYATDSSDAKGAVVSCEVPLNELLALSKTNGLRRFAANWLRLVLLLIGGIPPWFGSSESWRYGHVAYKHFPFGSTRPIHPQIMDFDSSMGYPGEGPPVIPQCLAVGLVPPSRRYSWILAQAWTLWTFSLLRLGSARAAGRGDLELPQGRPVLPETQKQRDKLLGYFSDWLRGHGFELEEILMTATPDLETLNTLVERYGRELYRSGRPYGHYSETLNAISGKRPRVRRHLQPAWDLAYAWLRQEPPVHHLALPWQALLALITTSWTWGWSKVTGVIALSWGGITRIGEVLSACRRDLILPADVEWSINYALLQIAEPKTRYRSARHQIARLDQPQLLKVIEVAFGGLLPEQRLWPASGQTMRHRFQKLLQANRLDTLPEGISRGIDLGSLRAGGASWLLMSSENSELTRRRGRWITSKVMEVYVEEAWSVQFLPRLPSEVKKLIWNGAQIFPWALDLVVAWHGAKIPESAWPCLFLQASKDFELNHLGEKKLGGEAAAAAVCAAPKEP
ncbi:Retrovirus-related Pol polyprotein from transposon TNT 1-94 [Durusdinium trenchii]|uniref:Retrovirus-related Pol polyprotein from transposon TNT 1-94 n=1 Tax=Durusdinium trenchii TaxID=1381693 RepID=A0ABP0JYL6_9DINO